MKSRALLLCVSNLWMLPIAANAQVTIHVPADASTIQAGIDAAQNGDTILVAPGSYNENIDFKGKGIIVTSGAQVFSDPLPAINGVKNGAVATFGSGESPTAVLNGFVLQGGSYQCRRERHWRWHSGRWVSTDDHEQHPSRTISAAESSL